MQCMAFYLLFRQHTKTMQDILFQQISTILLGNSSLARLCTVLAMPALLCMELPCTVLNWSHLEYNKNQLDTLRLQ